MADAEKREKLAAAKKRLKQFKQQSRGSPTPAQQPVPSKPSQPPQPNKPSQQPVPNKPSQQPQPNKPSQQPQPNKPSLQSPSKVNNSNEDDLQSNQEQQADIPDVSSSSSEQSIISVIEPPEPTERLQQLSKQLNGQLSEPDAYDNTSRIETEALQTTQITSLKAQNRESLLSLDVQKRTNDQLSKQLQEMKNNNCKLQQNLDVERKGFDDKLKRELEALKDQLKVHIQTIGILVSEKTELQASLGENQKMADQRLKEIEELSGRLKASRQRVGDLEKSFTSIITAGQKHEKTNKALSKDVDRLKLQLYKLNKGNEEYQQQNSEMHNKLQIKAAECDKSEVDCIELRGKLEMAQLHVQQLQSGAAETDNTDQVDRLVADKAQLQAQLDQYNESFQKVSAEREQIAAQYQQYIDQLTLQSQQLNAQVTGLVDERDQLTRKTTDLQTLITDLQTQQASVTADASAEAAGRESLASDVSDLTQRCAQLTAKYDALVTDNTQLSSLLAEREAALLQTEQRSEELRQSQESGERLLASVQSDRTALSRAVAQNKQLKERQCELEDKFVSVTNENADLLTQLQREEHSGRELAARVGGQEDELKMSREEVVVKEQQLVALQLKQQLLLQQQQQLAAASEETPLDSELQQRLIQQQQQAPLLDSLQIELTSAQDTINSLTNQNSVLEERLLEGLEKIRMGEDEVATDAQVRQLSQHIETFESERDAAKSQLSSESAKRDALQAKLDTLMHDLAHQAPATINGDIVNRAQFDALQHAMKQLEVKYTKAMRDKADLTDTNERLEHIVMQLQGETDTIGEYITLYQHQRGVLKAKAMEKDNYISKMARDQEQMTLQLEQLRPLVVQLLGEGSLLPGYSPPRGLTPLAPRHPTPHQTPRLKDVSFGATLDSSQLEDWPDYNSSGGESEASEVVAIIGGEDATLDATEDATAATAGMVTAPSSPASPKEQAAQQILHLLDSIELTSSGDGRVSTQWNYLQCNRCTGQLLVV